MSALDRAVKDPPGWDALRDESDLAGLTRRTVKGYDLWGHSIAVVCPSASALGLAVWLPNIVGPGAWVSALIGFGLAYLLALAFSEFASRMAGAGSLATYASRGIGAASGLVVAACMLLGYGALVSFGLTNSANRVGESVESLTSSGAHVMSIENAVLGASVVLCIAIMMRGVHGSTRVAFVAEAITLSVLLLLLALTAARDGLPSPSILSLEGANAGDIVLGAAIVMTVTVGFESAAALGVEAERPFLSVPRSMTRTVVLSGVLFALAMFVSTGRAGSRGLSPGQRWLGTEIDVQLADAFLQIVLAVSFFACGLCAWTALSRVVFSLSRGGVLPAVLGRTHPIRHTPYVAIAVTAPVVMLPSAISLLSGHHIGWTTHKLLGGATVVLFVAYVLVGVAVPFFLRSIDELTAGPVLVAMIAVVGVSVLAVVDVMHDLGQGDYLDLVLTGGAVTSGWIWFTWLSRRTPDMAEGLAVHDETVAADILGGSGSSDRE